MSCTLSCLPARPLLSNRHHTCSLASRSNLWPQCLRCTRSRKRCGGFLWIAAATEHLAPAPATEWIAPATEYLALVTGRHITRNRNRGVRHGSLKRTRFRNPPDFKWISGFHLDFIWISGFHVDFWISSGFQVYFWISRGFLDFKWISPDFTWISTVWAILRWVIGQS